MRGKSFLSSAAGLGFLLGAPGLFHGDVAHGQAPSGPGGAPVHAEVIIYGGTPSGIMAAVAAARHGHTVALVDINHHVGGVVSGGLCESDVGDRKTIGGLSREFFDRVLKYYTGRYGATSEQVQKCEKGAKFEPGVAEKIFNDMLGEQQSRITVYHDCRFKSATLADGRVTSLVTDCLQDHSVRTFTGDIFIDASYEGDLMAGVHVPYSVGREGRDEFNESLAGVSAGPDKGKADKLVMAYNYRLCLTPTVENRVLFPKPDDYHPEHWAKIYAGRIKSGKLTSLGQVLWPDLDRKVGPNDKYDDNADDLEGGSANYPEGDWATRDHIAALHRDYVLSKLYYLQSDPDLPPSWRDEAAKWGLARDEFTDNGHFPFQLYIREARRMIGAYVLRQDDLTQNRFKPDGVCDGSYGVDCHIVRRLVLDGKPVADLTPHVAINDYDIPYACLTPKDHPDNLLVSVCVSATHVATCSLRMEPVYMMLGHAAGDAAHLALDHRTSVQRVDVNELREFLLQEHAILDDGYAPQVQIVFTPGHPKPGASVHFQAVPGALKDPLTKFWWDFEGTGKIGAQGDKADHAFALEKVYHASLVVEDAAGRRRLVPTDVPVGAAAARDVMVDDLDARKEGRWNPGYPVLPDHPEQRYSDVFIDAGIGYDMLVRGTKAPAYAKFQPELPRAGRYLVCFGYRPEPQAESRLPVTVSCDGQITKIIVNEKVKETPFPFVSLGEFHCDAGTGSYLEMDNSETTDRIAVDAVRWVWAGD